MSTDNLIKDVNEIGKRITQVDKTQEDHRGQIEDHSGEIKDLWRIVNEIREENKNLNTAISKHALSVSTRISKMEINIGKQITRGILGGVVIVAVPILAFIFKT